MTTITKQAFEKTKAGEQTYLYTMTNANGSSVTVCDYGGTLISLLVPNRDGNLVDVLLGYEHLSGYEESDTYFGALIGRCGNRICKGHFTLNGKEYQLAVNNGENHLHGGMIGFDSRIFHVEQEKGVLKLLLHCEDGEENYPGNADVTVTYTFTDDNELQIHYEAISDQDTLMNLTNHAYFNLDGHASGSIADTMLKLYATSYTPTDTCSIPTGEIAPIAYTAFDFTNFRRIGEAIDSEEEQLRFAGGYDHNFVLDHDPDQLSLFAEAYSQESGIYLTAKTTLPGVQFYTGNFIGEHGPAGKNGCTYHKRQGFCLETQVPPDAINHPNFPSPVLKAGEKYDTLTTYCFSLI